MFGAVIKKQKKCVDGYYRFTLSVETIEELNVDVQASVLKQLLSVYGLFTGLQNSKQTSLISNPLID